MAELNHTIVFSHDKERSARFLSEVLGCPEPTPFGPFLEVKTSNGVSLDFMDTDEELGWVHLAFLVSEDEFDEVLGRIKARDLPFFADHRGERPGQWNTNDGGRGLYWSDPEGRWLEIITRPYGSGG